MRLWIQYQNTNIIQQKNAFEKVLSFCSSLNMLQCIAMPILDRNMYIIKKAAHYI